MTEKLLSLIFVWIYFLALVGIINSLYIIPKMSLIHFRWDLPVCTHTASQNNIVQTFTILSCHLHHVTLYLLNCFCQYLALSDCCLYVYVSLCVFIFANVEFLKPLICTCNYTVHVGQY